MSELRRDPVTGRWVIISTERSARPTDFAVEPSKRKGGFCPFCEGNETKTPPEITAYRAFGTSPDTPGWRVRVVANKYPALQIEGDLHKRAQGIYDVMNGIGAHEVVIETPRHDATISTLTSEAMVELIWMYRERLIDLERDPRFQYILIFRNSGEAAGASLEHPHTQIIATPTIPKRIMEEVRGVKAYLDFKDRCVFCDMVAEELDTRKRIVAENELFVAFTAFAARFPFETWILPKKHQAGFEEMPPEHVPPFAHILQETIHRIDTSLSFPPYNYLVHTNPCNVTPETHFYHWHLEIIPRLTKVAGFEWGSGFYINPTPPESAAELLRAVEIP